MKEVMIPKPIAEKISRLTKAEKTGLNFFLKGIVYERKMKSADSKREKREGGID